MPQFHNTSVKNGLLVVDKKRFLRAVKSLPDGDYILCLIKQHNGSTRDFQKLYFAQLGEWAFDTGWTKEELHDMVKAELFVELFGEPISTADLTTVQWNMLIGDLQGFLIVKFENS